MHLVNKVVANPAFDLENYDYSEDLRLNYNVPCSCHNIEKRIPIICPWQQRSSLPSWSYAGRLLLGR